MTVARALLVFRIWWIQAANIYTYRYIWAPWARPGASKPPHIPPYRYILASNMLVFVLRATRQQAAIREGAAARIPEGVNRAAALPLEGQHGPSWVASAILR